MHICHRNLQRPLIRSGCEVRTGRHATAHLSSTYRASKENAQRDLSSKARHICFAAAPEADLVEVELNVEGLECGKCSSRVHNALMELEIVKEANVSHEDGKALLQVNALSMFDAWNELPRILETIDSLGFIAVPCLGDKEE